MPIGLANIGWKMYMVNGSWDIVILILIVRIFTSFGHLARLLLFLIGIFINDFFADRLLGRNKRKDFGRNRCPLWRREAFVGSRCRVGPKEQGGGHSRSMIGLWFLSQLEAIALPLCCNSDRFQLCYSVATDNLATWTWAGCPGTSKIRTNSKVPT